MPFARFWTLAGPRTTNAPLPSAYGQPRRNCHERGVTWEAAVDYFNQALALDEELGRKEGMATQYGNLGCCLQAGMTWMRG